MVGSRGKGNIDRISGCRNDIVIYGGGSVNVISDDRTQHQSRKNGGTGINGGGTSDGARM